MCKNAGKNILTIASVALTSLTAVLKITNPNDPNLAKYEADAALLLQQLANWKTGSAATQVIEAIDLVISDVNLIPVPPTQQAIIAIALAGLESIIAIVNQNSTVGGASQVASAKVMEAQQIDSPAYSGPDAALYYARDWNSEVGKQSTLAHAKIKMRGLLDELLP